MELESGPGLLSFPRFEDEDGELLLLKAAEIVYVVAPLHLLEDGSQMHLEEADD